MVLTQAVKQLLHKETSNKIVVCSASDPELPPGWRH